MKDSTLYRYYASDPKGEYPATIYNTIKFSDPKEFNDPLDCTVYAIRKDWEYEYFKDKKSGKKRKKQVISYQPRYHYSFDDTTYSNNIRVACFTSNEKNLLMWAHYANMHQGICLGFRTVETIVNEKPCYQFKFSPQNINIKTKQFHNSLFAHNVIYEDSQYKAYDPRGENHSELFSQFKTKSTVWNYEDEFRILASEKTLRGNNLIKLDHDQISEVIFGLKFDFEKRQNVINNLRINNPSIRSFQITIEGLILKTSEINNEPSFKTLKVSPTTNQSLKEGLKVVRKKKSQT